MVFGLFPVDPQSSEKKYYIFAKGSYKVGRKGCDIIITNDKGVSRIHAEIIVDEMISSSSLQTKSKSSTCKVRIKDCSKYGTFVNRNLGSVEKVHELPNKEASLIDGNIISFGSGNAAYKFSLVPLVIWVCSMEPCQVHPLQDKLSSIGAQVTYTFSQECTHVLVDDFIPVREDLLDGIAAKKACIRSSWVTSITKENIGTEIPSFSLHTPTITVGGVSVKLAEPTTLEGCLEGYTFVLDSINNYKFSNQLKSIIELSGAEVFSVEGLSSGNQRSDTESNDVVCVIPGGSGAKLGCFNKFSSVSRINETDLICSILAGKLDRSLLISPSVVVSSSCSTDETIVADSEAEDETATSARDKLVMSHSSVEIVETVSKMETPDNDGATIVELMETVNKIEQSDDRVATDHTKNSWPHGGGIPVKKERGSESGSENSNIIYSQCLIVRDIMPSTVTGTGNNEGPDFKRFKKKNTESGNSFGNFIPYSQHPYRESDTGNEEVVKSMKDEKRRKQTEAIAEDLFNNERGRRRGVSGSIRELLI